MKLRNILLWGNFCAMNKLYPILSCALIIAIGMFMVSCDDDSDNSSDPDRIVTANGLCYKGSMGSNTTDNPLTFRLTDEDNDNYPYRRINFSLLEGDGELSATSVETDKDGEAVIQYLFNGSLGHAVIRAAYSDITPSDVYIRASTIIPGVDGQGQYVLFEDTYKDVKDFNGLPASVDVDPNYYLLYVNYEAAKGVVVMIDDENQDELISDDEDVIGVIVNTIYTGKTADSIGIGSTIADLRTAYGTPDMVWYDPTYPPAVVIQYSLLGMTCYGERASDTTIFEIHVTENIEDSEFAKKTASFENRRSFDSISSYRLMSF